MVSEYIFLYICNALVLRLFDNLMLVLACVVETCTIIVLSPIKLIRRPVWASFFIPYLITSKSLVMDLSGFVINGDHVPGVSVECDVCDRCRHFVSGITTDRFNQSLGMCSSKWSPKKLELLTGGSSCQLFEIGTQ